MPALLETVDLTKTYKVGPVRVEALRGVTLAVETGEIVAVMGPSGCGKSSLMHILGAMTDATSGVARIDGVEIGTMSDAARTAFRRDRIGFVFQKFNLLPTLTARANIKLSRTIHGSHKDPESDRFVEEIVELLAIGDKLDRRPVELSGGEQQRVAIARAVVKRPAIILADEPTGNLDSRNSDSVLNMFRELNRRLGQTVILVTHNPELTAFTDRVIEMKDGRVLRDSGSRATAAVLADTKKGN
jgi:putative ABC transport system ATP-binding protein